MPTKYLLQSPTYYTSQSTTLHPQSLATRVPQSCEPLVRRAGGGGGGTRTRLRASIVFIYCEGKWFPVFVLSSADK